MYVPDMASITPTRRSLRDAGHDVREMRTNEGLSREQLSHLIGVAARTIERIEAGGRPRVRSAFLLANYFECEVSELWPAL